MFLYKVVELYIDFIHKKQSINTITVIFDEIDFVSPYDTLLSFLSTGNVFS